MSDDQPYVSIVLPCRNEQEGLAHCLQQINAIIASHNIRAEVIVSDSSIDNSPRIAKHYNARLIKHDCKGYGVAVRTGLKHAQGRCIFIADADGSYDFNELPSFLEALEEGDDMVIGRRTFQHIQPGAMPWHHKYIGNPLLSFLVCTRIGQKHHDVHCGMRAITRNAYTTLTLQTTGMEFATEFFAKAHRTGLRITQRPIYYYPRIGRSKLCWWRDGLRHLGLILRLAPIRIPGITIQL